MKQIFLFFGFSLLLSACAIISMPEGGAKDETPPMVVSTSPTNKSIEFTAKEISIEFDEYITIQNFTTQFFASPPLKYPVKQRIKSKTLILTLADTLAPNTTYTFSFGNSILDISEGNVQSDFKYVFSTGPVLDSLKITGAIFNAYTGLPEEGMIAMLYRKSENDSIIYNQKPNYYAYSDKEGRFSIENLSSEPFMLLAIKDENLNQQYNPGLEKLAFEANTVYPGAEAEIQLRAFAEKTSARLIDAKQMDYGKIIFAFSEKITNPQIAILGTSTNKKATEIISLNAKSDTVTYWYNPTEYDKNLREFYYKISTDQVIKDSVRVNLRELKPEPLKITTGTPKVFGKNDSLFFLTNYPIAQLDASKIIFIVDTLKTEVKISQPQPMQIVLDTKPEFNKNYTLKLSSGALVDIFGNKSDSAIFKLESAAEDELAILHLKVLASDIEPKIAELINDQGKTIRTYFFTDQLSENLLAMPPGKYGLRIVWDINENNVWDVGNFLAKKQPEHVLYYPKPIELRANWEVETIWEMP